MASSSSIKSPAAQSKLNPSAEEWKPPVQGSRMLFMTLSNDGPAIDEFDIAHYFQQEYGDCVENVYMNFSLKERVESGHVLFRSSIWPVLVLGKSEKITIIIEGKKVDFKPFKRAT